MSILLAALLTIFPASAASAPIAAPDEAALRAVTHDLCRRQVALLGEAVHGDGHTDSFKAALVERLITRCHFNAVFFEASLYEFLAFDRDMRARRPVNADMVGAAIGGLWKFDREVKPLIPFLFDRANASRVRLGGIDGQLGGLEQRYSNEVMPAELTAYLAEDRQKQCREALRRRIYYDYPAGTSYDAVERAEILQCAYDIERAMSGSPPADPTILAEQREMLGNIVAFTLADGNVTREYIAARDAQMYRNFRWLARRLPPQSKIIVWGATAHIARDDPADADFVGVPTFGSFLRRDYGARAFALGFSASGGAYRYSRKNDRHLPPPPPDSLEAIATKGSGADTAYLGPAALHDIGAVPGAAFGHDYHIVDWPNLLDGIVVFRTEYPPHSDRPGY